MDQTDSKKPQKGILDYSIGSKTVKQYLGIIKTPLLALIGLDVLSFLTGLLNYMPVIGFIFSVMNFFVGVILLLAGLLVGAYIGYRVVKKHSGDLLDSAAAGAIAGFISGAINGVLNIFSTSIGIGAGHGSSTAIAMVAAVVGLILSPVFEAILVAILSLIGGAVAGARTFGPYSAQSVKTEPPKTKPAKTEQQPKT